MKEQHIKSLEERNNKKAIRIDISERAELSVLSKRFNTDLRDLYSQVLRYQELVKKYES